MSKSAPRLLLVDDDKSLLRLLKIRLQGSGYQVETAENGNQALQLLQQTPVDVVVSDLRMDDIGGIELFEMIQNQHTGLPVIIITAQGSIQDAVAATQKGVFGFLTKPVNIKELLLLIDRALGVSPLKPSQQAETQWREHIKSRSGVMEQLLTTTAQIAGSDVSVLIHGQSGTGKELLAQAVHQASSRSQQPFIPINCSALPEPLLESELFGHVKGAFSGAVADHQGLFRAADGGTLFLDEIGDMPLALQAKLLRVLQDRQVRPVGSTRLYPVNVRLVSATHRDLDQMMEDNEFRQDLYYRINVVKLEIPPLNQRPEDIALLANHFLIKACELANTERKQFSPNALELLIGARWPGNVRQLENTVQELMALTPGRVIGANRVRQTLSNEIAYLPSYSEARRQFEHDYLSKLLRLTSGNVTQAARLAQRNRTDFYKLLQRHQLKAEQFKGSQ
ncbi:sigma 54-interacting transcriptional regulator [Motiliproteus sp.]|uniref:sigma 54-interacting transcriptional regulator n=1 Tax=Motiliproteus sp. TaxID=1898955 RepID=UPI003BAC8C47